MANITITPGTSEKLWADKRREAFSLRIKLLERNIGRTYTISEAAFIINSKQLIDGAIHEHVLGELIKRYTDLLMRREIK